MDWIRTARAFGPAMMALVAMVVGMELLTRLGQVEQLGGIVPMAR